MKRNLQRFLLATCLGAAACPAADTPRAALLVLNKGDNSLAIVDPGAGKVVATLPSGPDPHEVVAFKGLAFISNYGGNNTLSVVDLVAQKALSPVNLGALRSPHGLWVAQGKVYFTAEANKIIGSYDPASQQIDWLLGLGQERTHMIVVSPDAKKIYTANVNSDTISLIERGSGPGGPGRFPGPGGPPGFGGPGPPPGPFGGGGWNATHVVVGKGPEGFDVSPDGKEVWAANSHDGTVSIIDVSRKSVVKP